MNIAITQRILLHKNRAYDSLDHGWYNLLKNHTLFYVPNTLHQIIDLTSIDLLLLTGGDDHPMRRLIETRLITQAYILNKPILGICHGALVINELEQGINDTIDNHSNISHKITLENKYYTVNSHHNMSLKKLGDDLQVIATAEDNSIEAFRHRKRSVFGLMWHPERMENPILPSELSILL